MGGEGLLNERIGEIVISVIVPIYRVQLFIERCVRSLFEQTLIEGVEYVFVDDASPDNSISVLKKCLEQYPERKDQVKIITHAINRGLPAARNSGLEVAKGEYIFHCDSDDYVEKDMLEILYRAAKEEDADIVWCDWYLSFAQNERYMKQPAYLTANEALRAMLGGAMKFNVWNKLVKRCLYVDNKITFPSGFGMGEDMTMMMLFAYAQKVCYVPKAFYHYVKTNAHAFSQTYSAKHLEDLRYNVQRIVKFLKEKYGSTMEKEIAFLKLEAKFPFLISDGNKGWYQLWTEWYPEANCYILQNKYVSLRSRMLQWCAWKGWFGIVRGYYWLINRLVYGVIYK